MRRRFAVSERIAAGRQAQLIHFVLSPTNGKPIAPRSLPMSSNGNILTFPSATRARVCLNHIAFARAIFRRRVTQMNTKNSLNCKLLDLCANFAFVSDDDLRQHLQLCLFSATPTFSDSGRALKRPLELDKSSSAALPQPQPQPKEAKTDNLSCELCHKTFARAYTYQRHLCFNEEYYETCAECGEKFRKDNLLRHLSVHSQAALDPLRIPGLTRMVSSEATVSSCLYWVRTAINGASHRIHVTVFDDGKEVSRWLLVRAHNLLFVYR